MFSYNFLRQVEILPINPNLVILKGGEIFCDVEINMNLVKKYFLFQFLSKSDNTIKK